MKRDKDNEDKRRSENPTEAEQVVDVLTDMVDSVTYHLVREERTQKHKARKDARSILNPTSFGFHMRELPEGGQGAKGVPSRKLVTDILFFDAKVTKAGDVLCWKPQVSERAGYPHPHPHPHPSHSHS